MTLNDVRNFVKLHVVRLSEEILAWQTTGSLPSESWVDDVAIMCMNIGIPVNTSLSVAEALITSAAMEYVVEMGKPS